MQPIEIGGKRIELRRLRADDAPRLLAFQDSLSAESKRTFTPHAYDDATISKIIDRALRGLDATFVATFGGQIVAYFFLWHSTEPVPLLGIGITDAWQGKGLGRVLMETLIAEARSLGRDGIELTTMLDNDRAFALYQKVGFRYIGNVDNITGDGRKVVERRLFYSIRPGAQPPDRIHGPPA